MSNENTAEEQGRTRLTSAEYAQRGGRECPVCRSTLFSASGMSVDGGAAGQAVSCRDCGSSWVDTYRLVGYDELEATDGQDGEGDGEDETAPDTRLAEILVAECGFSADAATYAAEVACRMAERHQSLVARDLNGDGDSEQLKREIADVEFNLRSLFGIRDGNEACITGIDGLRFSGDALAPTVRILFRSKTSNSFSGGWALGI